MVLPVSPMVLPSSLLNQANGQLDPSLLVSIHPRGQLHITAVRAWKALVAECGKQGLPLTFTYGGCYRTYAEQEWLFRSRYTTTYISGASRKFWQGMWWYLKPGNAMAAVPGTSNHGLGLAIDTAFDTDPTDGLGPDDAAAIANHPKFLWFRDNIIRFGFSFEAQSETWHIRYVAGDNIPQAVLAFENAVIPNFPPFVPEKGLWGIYPVANKPGVKYGSKNDFVKYLQGVMKLKASQPITIDGDFGPKTEAAVKNVQSFFHLVADGLVGPKTWALIDALSQF